MPAKKLKEFLDKNKVKYLSIVHSPAYSAMEIAEASHVPGKDLAKTVIVNIDNVMSMVVLPAPLKIDLSKLKSVVGANKAELASEHAFASKFPDCEVGAMPPFGNLYNMPVYVDDDLAKDEEIAFNSGTHSEVIKLKYKDFYKLVKPKVVNFT